MSQGGQVAGEGKRGPTWLPVFFALLAVVLGVAAVVTGVRERERQAMLPTPPSQSGSYTAINVLEALRAQGLTADFGKRGVPAVKMPVPGQELIVNGVPAYAFLFEGAEVAQESAAKPEAAAALPPDATPVAGGPLVVQGSNVVLVLNGGDGALRQKVTAAVRSLT